MTIYITDIENDRITPIEYGSYDPEDIEYFEKDMTDIYGDFWFYDVFDALDCLITGVSDVS